MTEPEVAGMSCMMVRERVDLPQPDSPTRPRISPSSMLRVDAVDGFDGVCDFAHQYPFGYREVGLDVVELQKGHAVF